MKYLKYFENKIKKGDKAYWKVFDEIVDVLDVDGTIITIKDKNGIIGDWLIKDFIPEIEYEKNKYNL